MQIKVGWQDILFGERGNPFDCAVARAVERQVPSSTMVSVCYGPNKAVVELYVPRFNANGWHYLQGIKQRLDASIRAKIRFFDRWHFMRPFSFELNLEAPKALFEQPKSVSQVINELEAQMQEVESHAVPV